MMVSDDMVRVTLADAVEAVGLCLGVDVPDRLGVRRGVACRLVDVASSLRGLPVRDGRRDTLSLYDGALDTALAVSDAASAQSLELPYDVPRSLVYGCAARSEVVRRRVANAVGATMDAYDAAVSAGDHDGARIARMAERVLRSLSDAVCAWYRNWWAPPLMWGGSAPDTNCERCGGVGTAYVDPDARECHLPGWVPCSCRA